MKKLMLLALVLAVAPASQAQVVTPMTRDYLFVIDANSKLVGYAPTSGPVANSISVTVGYSAPGPGLTKVDSVVLRMISDEHGSGHRRFHWVNEYAPYFASADCTGQAYLTEWSAYPTGRRLGAIFDIVEGNNTLYVSAPDPGLVSFTAASYRLGPDTPGQSGCYPYGPSPIQGFAVNPAVNLDTVWQGPFRTY